MASTVRIRSTVNNSDAGRREAIVRAPYFENRFEGRASWGQFKTNLYETAVAQGEASLDERRRLHRALGRDAFNRVPLAIGIFDGNTYALVAPLNEDIRNNVTVAEVIPFNAPTAW